MTQMILSRTVGGCGLVLWVAIATLCLAGCGKEEPPAPPVRQA